MKNIGFFIIAALVTVSCSQRPASDNESGQESQGIIIESPARDGVFIHISEGYDDPHRVLMALKMASIMSEDKDVIVYMDIDAVEILVNGSEDVSFADFESAHTYIQQLAENNVGVYACPTCLNIAGFTPDDLLDGVQTAEKDRFFNFTEGRIITLDY